MVRAAFFGCTLLLVLALALPGAAPAPTKDDTIVYALQSDIDTWDPPGSVPRETIIMGHQVFDHLALRDLKTRKVVPHLALSWKNIDDTTWEVLRCAKAESAVPTPASGREAAGRDWERMLCSLCSCQSWPLDTEAHVLLLADQRLDRLPGALEGVVHRVPR